MRIKDFFGNWRRFRKNAQPPVGVDAFKCVEDVLGDCLTRNAVETVATSDEIAVDAVGRIANGVGHERCTRVRISDGNAKRFVDSLQKIVISNQSNNNPRMYNSKMNITATSWKTKTRQ